jgi:sugar lactone lactonase YvrE
VSSLSVDADGRVRLGPAQAVLHDPGQPYLWTAVADRAGVLFVGSGGEGRVYRLDRQGRASVFFDADEPDVHALAWLPDGNLLVATAPDGRIYRVDPQGRASTFFDPESKYIWALVVDPQGVVYAGTGTPGVIYRIAPDGAGAPWCKAGADNVVDLVLEDRGSLLAATGTPGKVLRIQPNGRVHVLLDTGYREARGLKGAGRGHIYAVALDGAAPPEEAPAADQASTPPRGEVTASVSAEVTSFAVVDVSAAPAGETRSGALAAARQAPKGAVVSIQPDGSWDTVWESSDDLPMDLAIDSDGSLIVATGSQGRIFRIADDPPKATWLAQVPAQQATRLVPAAAGGFTVLTSNPGKIVSLGPGHAATGSYLSEVRDTQTVSTWGAISWRGAWPAGSSVAVSTRSGNSRRPDDTWSEWSEPYRNPEGSQVTSPKARYLQWRAVLNGVASARPALTSVSVAYQQRNLRPRVTAITVHPAGVVFQKPYPLGDLEIAGLSAPIGDTRPSGSAPPPASAGGTVGRRAYQKGLQTFQWKGEDPNDDALRYDLLYRPDHQTAWKALARNLADTVFVWDTTSVPNGRYLVRVVATDALSNPQAAALTHDLDSEVFMIDNTAPVVRVTGLRRTPTQTVITFEASDADSPLMRVDYSVDAEPWRRIDPADGLCDSSLEAFELVFDGDLSVRTAVIRAVDILGNVGTTRVDQPSTGSR